jgi:Glycosyl transferases group 1
MPRIAQDCAPDTVPSAIEPAQHPGLAEAGASETVAEREASNASPYLPPPSFRRHSGNTLRVQGEAHVIHVAGRLGGRASAFLQSAMDTLAQVGVQQTLVLVDDPEPPAWIAHSHRPVDLVTSPCMGSRLRTWWTAMRTVQRTITEHPGATVHLHGFLPSVFGARALSCAGFKAQVLYSLHGERAVAPWTNLAALPQWMLSRKTRRPQVRVMTSSRAEDHPPSWIGAQAHEFVEVPVAPVFFDTPHHETRHPLIAMSPRAEHTGCADACAQLAVLMGGSDLRLSFNWLGEASGADAALLKAANIGAFPKLHDQDRASRLAAAWLYISLDTQPGYAEDLAQAMAVGLPCIALESRNNRDLIEHGLTGYLCRNRSELMVRIAELLDDAPLRERMGRAALERARRRFSDQRFERKLLRAYGLEAVPV